MLGAEGKGLRQLTRETCSAVARLDMPGEIKSLNVSNAAVLALYIGATQALADALSHPPLPGSATVKRILSLMVNFVFWGRLFPLRRARHD